VSGPRGRPSEGASTATSPRPIATAKETRWSFLYKVQGVLLDGRPEPYSVKPVSNGKRVYIGNPDRLVQPGVHDYTLAYRTSRQLGFFKDHDELYWNVTGNGWSFPIDSAWCVVTLPDGNGTARVTMTEAYTGRMGENGPGFSKILSDPGVSARYVTTRSLAPGEGFSIVAGWPKGLVREPSSADRLAWKMRDNAGRLALFAGLAVLLLYYLLVWARYGKDPRPGTIIPRFAPPEGFSPGGVRYVYRMGYDDRCFTSTLLNAAVKGVVTIEQDGDRYFLRRGRNPISTPSTPKRGWPFTPSWDFTTPSRWTRRTIPPSAEP
jgi:Predicted membrane protein (DUF2207).